MSAIDQVIARARQGEVAFAERKQFKLARTRAIEKLRRFALADPYFYILELIQAAVAGGADYVDISCADEDVLISWTGGCVRETELAQLFDFLFASKERVDLANVRSLALGINALLLFEPEDVVIESGDGSEGGTTRMVVRGGAESVEVGRAKGTLNGTYVRARKLDRGKVAAETGRRGDEDGSLEFSTVESRCLAAPVPVVFNGDPMFGWSRQRVPSLFGYREVQTFDEGDLYGTIGRNPSGGEASFQLLTQGVWIQSYQYDLIKGHKLGGIVCFDALHKTVDHSGFVRDDRFEELWIRLRPYAEAIIGGKAAKVAKVTSAEGIEFSAQELRELLREHPRVVISPPTQDREIRHRAKVIARLLDAEVLCVPASQANSVRVLGGHALQLWRPDLRDDTDLRFYTEEPVAPPARPHLRPPAELDAPSAAELVDELMRRSALGGMSTQGWLGMHAELSAAGLLSADAKGGDEESKVRAMLRGLVGESGAIKATLYSPVEAGRAAHGLLVRVLSTGRLVDEQLFASAYPGRVLDVELPTAQASAAQTFRVVSGVADYFAALAVPLLREQDQRALAGLGVGKIEVGSAAARLALQVLSRVTMTRLRGARPGRRAPGLSFSLLRPSAGFDPFSIELFATVDGPELSLRDLSLATDATHGLVYATVPEVRADLAGLDRARILALDATSERTLIGMLGEAGYVRIDARDVLVEHRGVQLRDIALGLREYPDFPLLIEGAVEAALGLDSHGRAALVEILVEGLIRRLHGELDERGSMASELEEHRRQAVRHLQWYVCRELAAGHYEALSARGLLDLPLFLDLEGEVWGMGAVRAALASEGGLLVYYGHVLGSAELGALTQAARTGRAAAKGQPSSLALSAYSYRLLLPLGRMRLAFDFDLDDLEAASNPTTAPVAFLVRASFDSPHGAGVLGIPATPLPEHRIALVARKRGVVGVFDELAHLYGVVGSLELSHEEFDGAMLEALYASVDEQACALLERLVDGLAALGDDPRCYAAALRVLLSYAGERLTLIAGRDGVSVQVATPLAERILGLPLFDTGALTLVSAQRMLELFRRHFEGRYIAGEAVTPLDWSTVLDAPAGASARGAPALTHTWLDAHLQPARVVMPASVNNEAGSQIARGPGDDGPASLRPWPRDEPIPLDVLGWNLERWLAGLRPEQPESRGAKVETRIWLVELELASGGMFGGGGLRVEIYAKHPLVIRAQAEPSPRNLAWLLLAIYAHINAILDVVTNAHEAQFQVQVGDALLEGRLQFYAPPEHGAGADSTPQLFEEFPGRS